MIARPKAFSPLTGKESNTIKQKQTCLKIEEHDALDLLFEKGNIVVSQLPSSV